MCTVIFFGLLFQRKYIELVGVWSISSLLFLFTLFVSVMYILFANIACTTSMKEEIYVVQLLLIERKIYFDIVSTSLQTNNDLIGLLMFRQISNMIIELFICFRHLIFQ
jgi:hypothetical protein